MTLREYITTRLLRPVDIDQAATFFERPDTQACLGQMEQLAVQITDHWKQIQNTNPTETSSSGPALPTAEVNPKTQELIQASTLTTSDNQTDTEPSLLGSDAALTNDMPESTPKIPYRFTDGSGSIRPTQQPSLSKNPDTVRFNSTQQNEHPKPQRAFSIPNATVGKVYKHSLSFESLGLTDLSDHTLSVDSVTGLVYDSATQTLAGMPKQAGEFKFVLTYRLQTNESARPELTRQIDLLINADPRSLWKDLPSDTTDPYYRPDTDSELLLGNGLRLLAASVRGRSHAHEGKFRDDDFSLSHLTDTGWYLMSVADGAGSAKFSRQGARLACQTVTLFLQEQVEPQYWQNLDAAINQYAGNQDESTTDLTRRKLYDVLGKAVFAAYKAIETEALANQATSKDYATTLITVIAKPLPAGWFVGAFWVGDGGVGIYRDQEAPLLLGAPDGGEYAGQTRFLTMSDTISTNFFDRFQFAFVPDFTAIVLMTDGITDPKFQTDANLNRQEKWDELWADLTEAVTFNDDGQAPAQLLDWLSFWSPGNHDDRTLAICYPYADNAKN